VTRFILTFLALIAGQLTALAFLPKTQGFSNLAPTAACVGAFVFSVWMLARLSNSGMNLGILIPLVAAVVPLGGIIIGATLYGEHLSLPKLACLGASCFLIGAASRMA
jgi:multidrug transporter EmrE-like cation transporter